MRLTLRILSKAIAFLLLAAICFYKAIISPMLVGSCKFYPSCSDYFAQAVREWGVIRGSWLGIKRLARCTPFGMGGLDPVPRKKDASAD